MTTHGKLHAYMEHLNCSKSALTSVPSNISDVSVLSVQLGCTLTSQQSPYHPQAKGLMEKSVQIIKARQKNDRKKKQESHPYFSLSGLTLVGPM